jgi:hypothetical protein
MSLFGRAEASHYGMYDDAEDLHDMAADRYNDLYSLWYNWRRSQGALPWQAKAEAQRYAEEHQHDDG